MSHEISAVVMNHSRSTGTARLVLIGIANHHGDGGAWPAIATLARYANVHPRNVKKALRTLEALGEVKVHLQAGGLVGWEDHRRPNRYEITLTECPPWCDKTARHRDLRVSSALWTTGVTEASPGDGGATPPVTEAPPPRVTEAPPELPKELPHNQGVAVDAEPQDARELLQARRLAAVGPISEEVRESALADARAALRAAQEKHHTGGNRA